MHEYMNRITKAIAQGVLDEAPNGNVLVTHDKDCGVQRDQDCNCDPEVIIETAQGAMQVLNDGTMRGVPRRDATTATGVIQ